MKLFVKSVGWVLNHDYIEICIAKCAGDGPHEDVFFIYDFNKSITENITIIKDSILWNETVIIDRDSITLSMIDLEFRLKKIVERFDGLFNTRSNKI